MILIADSGSTKTHWCVLDNGQPQAILTTTGINPFFQSPTDIREELTRSLLSQLPGTPPEAIYFYGAGCIPEKAVLVQQALQALWAEANIHVHTDMLGAARGLCGHQPGIACILGTGSNSCFYNGTEIIANVSPLGFILGDEGSGAHLGKLLLGDLLKNQLPPAVKEEFLARYPLTATEIIEHVYRKAFPNRFLASFTPFLADHLQEPAVRNLVCNSFQAFIRRNVMQYDYPSHPVHFIGSVAYFFQDVLKEATQHTGIKLGTIQQSPLEGLIAYHNGKI